MAKNLPHYEQVFIECRKPAPDPLFNSLVRHGELKDARVENGVASLDLLFPPAAFLGTVHNINDTRGLGIINTFTTTC